MLDACANRPAIRERALAAQDRILREHDPAAYAQRLGDIYRESFPD